MCPALAMEAYRECCHCSSHSSPLSEMSTSEELRCVLAQSNCLLAFSNTSLVMAVEIASSFVHVHNDPFYILCFCLELVHGMRGSTRLCHLSSLFARTCTALSGKDHTCVCVCVCVSVCVCVCVSVSV